jgi:hypothetical protein
MCIQLPLEGVWVTKRPHGGLHLKVPSSTKINPTIAISCPPTPTTNDTLAFAQNPELNATDKIILRRASAGHFPCNSNSYLSKFKLRPTADCRFCKTDNETLEHLILECGRFSKMKFDFLGRIKINPRDLELKEYFHRHQVLKLTSSILRITIDHCPVRVRP